MAKLQPGDPPVRPACTMDTLFVPARTCLMPLHTLMGLGMAEVNICGAPARPAYARALVIAASADCCSILDGYRHVLYVAACSTEKRKLQHYWELRPSCWRCAYRVEVKMEVSASVLQACVQLGSTVSQQQQPFKRRLKSVSEHNEP